MAAAWKWRPGGRRKPPRSRSPGNSATTSSRHRGIGDLEVLLSSGFEAVKAPSPSVVPATPEKPTLSYTGKTGEMVFRFTGDHNVRNFSIEYGESATGPWTDFGLSSSTRVEITGLTPGKTYWARACANGAAGTSDWCTPAQT